MQPSRNLALFLHNSGSIYHITTDLDGWYTYANELYSTIFFHASDNLPREKFSATVFSEDIPTYDAAVEECLREPGKMVCVDLRRSRNDGSFFHIRWEFAAMEEDGQITGIQALGTDTSERKRAEREKEEAQEKLVRERYLLRTLIDHLPDYIYVKDNESRHVLTNRANLELIGVSSEEETLGKTVFDYLDEQSAFEHIQADRQLLASGTSLSNVEELVTSKNGQKKWLLTTRVALKQEGDETIGLVGISRDITDRKRIEESLRRSIERFNIVSKATNDAIWDWDLRTDHVLWNDAVVNMFGFTHEQIAMDKKWWENHIHPDDMQRVVSKVHQHIWEHIESWQDEYRFICADGGHKVVFDRGFILFEGDDRRPYRMIGAMMDITERKKLQDELAAQKLARQRQVTEATIMAQEKERAEIGRELHDNINQILTTTKMYLDMAMNEKEISEELMIKSHEYISTAIEEIRALSKSLVPPSLGDIGLKEAINEIVNTVSISQKLDIKVKTTGLSKVSLPGHIQLMVFRIVQEQLNNILKHAKATEAVIRLAYAKGELAITIADNGMGFDLKKRMKGIGLMNITSRAEVHNGQVQIITNPGQGCTLKISIPI